MLTVALAGAGFMSSTHAAEYAEMDDVAVRAVAAPSGAEQLIDDHGFDAEAYADGATMARDADVDFVDVCTPTYLHREVVEAAAGSGLDVFCEKPLAPTLADAEAVADAVTDAGVTCMVGHVLRFFPQYEAAKREVEEGAVGAPGVARTRRLSPFPDWGFEDWYADPARSGGVFLDLAIHDFDFLRWVWGDVERVFARQSGPDDAHGLATLRFENGAVANVEASWAQPDSREFSTELELAGDSGVLEVSDEYTIPYREFTDDGTSVDRPLDPDGYRRELNHFVECLKTDSEPLVGPADAIASMRVSLAACASAERGEPVAPSEVDA